MGGAALCLDILRATGPRGLPMSWALLLGSVTQLQGDYLSFWLGQIGWNKGKQRRNSWWWWKNTEMRWAREVYATDRSCLTGAPLIPCCQDRSNTLIEVGRHYSHIAPTAEITGKKKRKLCEWCPHCQAERAGRHLSLLCDIMEATVTFLHHCNANDRIVWFERDI